MYFENDKKKHFGKCFTVKWVRGHAFPMLVKSLMAILHLYGHMLQFSDMCHIVGPLSLMIKKFYFVQILLDMTYHAKCV